MRADRRFPFLDQLVLGIAEREKDLTRRLNTLRDFGPSTTSGYDWHFRDRRGLWNDVSTEQLLERWAPYRAGDVLAVCEALVPTTTIKAPPYSGGLSIIDTKYRADSVPVVVDGSNRLWPWKVRVLPARYCPKWAIRTRRRILSVRPERLSWVTDDDARREGIARLGWEPTGAAFVAGFRELHELDAGADPWVWRVEFSTEEVNDAR